MTRTQVNSSSISSIAYDENTRILELTFVSGATYNYSGVSQDDYDALMAADSKGKHFAMHIKPAHPHTRMP